MNAVADAIRAEIDATDQSIAQLKEKRKRLQDALNVLETDESSPLRLLSREKAIIEVLRRRGRDGLTRKELIVAMSQICASPPTSISTMLSRLLRKGEIQWDNGRWSSK